MMNSRWGRAAAAAMPAGLPRSRPIYRSWLKENEDKLAVPASEIEKILQKAPPGPGRRPTGPPATQ